MEILKPAAHFLRVADKFFGNFILRDEAVRTGPTVLYLDLFRRSYQDGSCRVSQAVLAKSCKCSTRAVQNHIRSLERLGYISVQRDPDGCHSYFLLLGERARFFIALERADSDGTAAGPEKSENIRGENSAPARAKILRLRGEKSAPFLRIKKNIKSPLSPLPSSSAHDPSGTSGKASSCTNNSRACPAAGRGDLFFHEKGAANAAFERFFAAWPRREAREAARSAWLGLWMQGDLPPMEELLAILARCRNSAMWLREHGRFVPYLVNWLRGKRWLDDAQGLDSGNVKDEKPPKFRPEFQEEEMRRRAAARRETAKYRPDFDAFITRFADGANKKGPAWGLWSLLRALGKAPLARDVPLHGEDRPVLDFLKAWQRGAHVPA